MGLEVGLELGLGLVIEGVTHHTYGGRVLEGVDRMLEVWVRDRGNDRARVSHQRRHSSHLRG